MVNATRTTLWEELWRWQRAIARAGIEWAAWQMLNPN